MNWVRKGLVAFLAFILFLALLWGVSAYNVRTKLSHPDKIETWLAESGIYDHMVEAALQQAQQEGDKNGTSISVSYKDSEVEKAANSAFSQDVLKSSAHSFIEGNYQWLSGKSSKPEFNVDLSQAKQNFADQVGKYVSNRLATLPICTADQLAKLQIPINPSTVTCRPASLDPKTEGSRVAEEITTSQDFLENPVLTADNFNNQAGSKPYYEKLKSLPKIYQLGQHLAWIMAVIAVICSAGIIFIHPSRRKGLRRVGTTFALAGVLLIATKFISKTLTNKLGDAVLTNSTQSQLDGSFTNFLHTLESQLNQSNMLFGTVFVVIGIAIFAYLVITREGRSHKQPSRYTSAAERPAETLANNPSNHPSPTSSDLSDRLRPQSPTGPPILGSSQPRRPSPPGTRPNAQPAHRPKPTRPPRLVQ